MADGLADGQADGLTAVPSGAPELGPGRLIGRLRGAAPGPTLIVVGGLHGNEPAGTGAAERVLARLEAEKIPLRGELVALRGNLRALRQGRRFLRRDLNRQWSDEQLAAAARAPVRADDPEAFEQEELRAALDEAMAEARGEAFFIDLHTTSADGIPFLVVGDTVRHLALVRHFPLPVILGLEEQIDGGLAEYMAARGCTTMVVEGGQHQSPAAAANLEAVLWLALAAVGLVARAALGSERDRAWDLLDRARRDLPRVTEVISRHAILPEHEFRMEPGFANIQRTRTGQLLARDRHGEIRAPFTGLVLLPLYQAQGDDGFFLGRAVPLWHRQVSTVARRLRLDALLPLLPGIRRHPAGRDHLHVDLRAAGRYPRLFYFFGYRKLLPSDPAASHVVLIRRPDRRRRG